MKRYRTWSYLEALEGVSRKERMSFASSRVGLARRREVLNSTRGNRDFNVAAVNEGSGFRDRLLYRKRMSLGSGLP